jgi:hypothetical protein
MDYPYFEIEIDRGTEQRLGIRTKYYAPGDDSLQHAEGAGGPLPLTALRALEGDDAAYGKMLSDALFYSDNVRAAFTSARDDNERSSTRVRVRLALSARHADLHGVHWEKLLEPHSVARISLSQRFLFSRLITDTEWRTTRPRTRNNIRALVLTANPSDADKYDLPEFEVTEVCNAAKSHLSDATVTVLGVDRPATLDALLTELRAGIDVLYVVCHGGVSPDNEAVLVLQHDDGTARFVKGADLVRHCREILTLPRFAFLASCDSASDANQTRTRGLVHLAPCLAEAGIAAVLGFHGRISTQGAQRFAERLFASLQKHGDIEAGVTESRMLMEASEHEWWSPSLLTRLRTSQLWYTPGFASAGAAAGVSENATWRRLIVHSQASEITPIVGSAVVMQPLGSRRELAHRWAHEFGYPLSSGDQESLPQVAQYVSVAADDPFMRRGLLVYTLVELLRAGNQPVPADLDTMNLVALAQSLCDVIEKRFHARRTADDAEPYSVVARMRARVFVTLDYTDQLFHALVAEGKTPTRAVCTRTAAVQAMSLTSAITSQAEPTVESPLVYHLFGRLAEPSTMVLTEDNYFDFLIGVARDKDLIPKPVLGALCNSCLMFIGCTLTEWDFRILFRTILSLPGFNKESRWRHLAVNVDPEDSGLIDPERARRFFERYFNDSRIEIYWGTAAEFLRELDRRMHARRTPHARAG